MAYQAIPTLLGQAAIAAAVAGEGDLDLASMVVGDGNGNPTTPVETQTALVNLRATIALQSVTRDSENPNRVNIQTVIDENTGGWTIREAGILDSDGNLLFVASVPATQKQTLADGVEDILTLGLYVVISALANITIAVSETTWATQGFVQTAIDASRTHIGTPLRPYFIAVDGVTVQAPELPAVGATYVVPVSPTGVWDGQAGKLAQFRGNDGWVFVMPPVGTHVAVGSAGTLWRKTNSGWRTVAASEAEHLLGISTELFTTPAGVRAMINAKFPADEEGVLANDGEGNLAWVARLDIIGLTAKSAANAGDWLAVWDPIAEANRRISVQMIVDRVAISDLVDSETFFMGMM